MSDSIDLVKDEWPPLFSKGVEPGDHSLQDDELSDDEFADVQEMQRKRREAEAQSAGPTD